MDRNSFTEDDKKKFVEFLNMVASKAEFTLNTKEIIEYYKLISHMQQSVLPKIQDHIFEVVKVTEPEPKEKPKRGRPKKETK